MRVEVFGCIAVCLTSLALPAGACKCQASYGPCGETRTSTLVFIGTVESIEPASLSRWNLDSRSAFASLNGALAALDQHPSVAALSSLKRAMTEVLPALTPAEEKQLEIAKSAADVASVFDGVLGRGTKVRFKAKTVFKNSDDDDDDDTDDDDPPKTLDVWTPFGDCGYDFQAGETYLVYASNDEGSDYSYTGKCTRTRRLSEAGEDLSYLYFYKEQRKDSSRLWGFATKDRRDQLALDQMHEPELVRSPVSGAIVELKSEKLVRYADTAPTGKFLFDGLPADHYRVSVFSDEYPRRVQLLAAPIDVNVKARSCTIRMLVVPEGSNP